MMKQFHIDTLADIWVFRHVTIARCQFVDAHCSFV